MGGEGSYQESSSTSRSDAKTPEQKAQLKNMLALYGPAMGENEDVWQGQRVVPFSDLQQQSITGAGNYADYFSTPQAAGTPLFNETGAATKGLLTGETGAKKMGRPETEQYFTETLYNPAMRNLKEEILPGIDESYAGPGFFGSARSHGRQEASEGTRDLLAGQWADLNWGVQQQNQAIDEAKAGRTLGALGPAMAFGQVPAQEIQNNLQIASQQIGGLSQLFNFGSAEQTQGQKELEAEIMKFAEENQITDPDNLAIMLTLLGMSFTKSRAESESFGVAGGGGMGYQG